MKKIIFISQLIALFCYTSICQDITPSTFELNQMPGYYRIPDSVSMVVYTDSIKNLYTDELLTGLIISSLHEHVILDSIQYVINGHKSGTTPTDNLGRFVITHTEPISLIQIKINNTEYHSLDTTLMLGSNSGFIQLDLEPRYKIMLRGRVITNNMPIEGVSVQISHNKYSFKLSTLSCYIDNEDYWNCLYLGMFKQAITFDNPDDSLKLSFSKPGYSNRNVTMKISDYDGDIMPIKLKYAKELYFFPQHNVSLQFGHTFAQSWSVGLQYLNQLQLGAFNRLGIGAEGSVLNQKVTTYHSTFDNLSQAKAETFYVLGMVGPVFDIAITNPQHRYLNMHAGFATPYIFPQKQFGIQPYLMGKIFLDLNKALVWEIRYIDYTIDQKDYAFNPYGNALETRINTDYTNMLYKLGLTVSFNLKHE